MLRSTVLCVLVCACGINAFVPPNRTELLTPLYFAYAAYCKLPALNSWTCEWCPHFPDFDLQMAYQNDTAESQFFAGYNPDVDTVVLSIRGTHNLKNVVEDLELIKKGVSCPNAPTGASVEDGFLKVMESLQTEVSSALHSLFSKYRPKKFLVTGHSLGAAVAELFVSQFGHPLGPFGWMRGKTPTPDLITFGCPRVGNKIYADWFSSVYRGNHVRVVWENDIVPHLPWMSMGFHHTRTEYWWQSNTNAKWCTGGDGEDPTCSNKVHSWHYNVGDHLNYLGIKEDGCP